MTDDLDRTISDRLRKLAPPIDTDDAFASVLPRARQARRRHQLRIGGVATGVVVAVVAIGVYAGGSEPDQVTPATVTSTSPPSSSTSTSSSTTSSSAPQNPTDTTSPTNTGPTSTAPTTAPTVTTPSTTPAPVNVPPTTYTNPGGTVVVRVDAGDLVLVSVTPAPGFEVTEQDETPDRIRVRFRDGDDGDHRFEIRMVDGAPAVERND